VTDASPLVVRAASTSGLLVLLFLLVFLFLAFHGRFDGSDPRLESVADRQDKAGFR